MEGAAVFLILLWLLISVAIIVLYVALIGAVLKLYEIDKTNKAMLKKLDDIFRHVDAATFLMLNPTKQQTPKGPPAIPNQ